MTKDYLVIYEEDDDGSEDDPFVVGVRRRASEGLGEVDIQHDVHLGLTNSSSRTGQFGFYATVLGAIVAFGFMVAFAVGFPDSWYNPDNSVKEGGFVTATMVTALVAFVLMVAGTALTHYGRRIKASGRIDGIRVVQKA